MRSFGAVALTLAIITECFGAQSDRDRSRQRAGPIRSVPVAADIKRDVDFDCPEEFGYYPHPSDCTLYYVCVFGGALLESCTGGLMYSHELQTCDWPRNVGCDGVSALGGEELERISERERDPPPPPPPPRRNPPPPPPRAQPNPVITSRGQPKFNREEYEKQQQLYAEVDDSPPVEEIESDRQQRVYRGQPSTIGQVQKDRDGYSQVNSGRSFNSNIIPASIPQNNGKIGSFSFGTQVDERRADERRVDDRRVDERRIDERRIDERRNNDRRTAVVTQAPQTYSEDKSTNVTDSHNDRQIDIATNEITVTEVIEKPILRKKRDALGSEVGLVKGNASTDSISDRSSNDEEMEYVEFDTETLPTFGDERGEEDGERGKRQIRYYLKNGYKMPGKNWGNHKQIQLVDLRQLSHNSDAQSARYPLYNEGLVKTQKFPLDADSAHSYQFYQTDNLQSQRPFKPSLPDPTKQKLIHNPANTATHIITKSPPISALKNYDNPFASLAGGFFNNNAPKQNSMKEENPYSSFYSSFADAIQLPSTVVTGKPTLLTTSPRNQNKYKINTESNKNSPYSQQGNRPVSNTKQNVKRPNNAPPNKEVESEEEDEGSSENEESEEEQSEEDFRHDFPPPPLEYTHYKFKDIENPFANPNFDFDAYLTKLSGGYYSATSPKPQNNQNSALKSSVPQVEITTSSNQGSGLRSSTFNYKGINTPQPFNGADEISITVRPSETNQKYSSSTKQNVAPENWTQSPQHQLHHGQEQQQTLNQHVYQVPHQSAGLPLDAVRPKLKPPNFKDDRQLPISYSFNRPRESPVEPNYNNNPTHVKEHNLQAYSVTQNPLVFLTATGAPLLLSTPKHQYLLKQLATAKPYQFSSAKPHNAYITFKQSTAKPLTTLANEQLAALQHYWGNSSPASYFAIQSTTMRPPSSEAPRLENVFSQSSQSARPTPSKSQNHYTTVKNHLSSSTRPPPKRRPIPKPSPEMNDYYYDEDEEDEQYYYEPPVKSQYMPSSEVKPQRPPMAQNYREYDDDEYDPPVVNIRPPTSSRTPTRFTTRKPETVTKNYNDVSVVTKGSLKELNKDLNGKIPIPVLVNYATPASTVLIRPEVSNYEVVHYPRNRTVHIRKPAQSESSPYTLKPPKYLNQTTLRPYTIRHRLAKPTASSQPQSQTDDTKTTRGRQRHQNIVAHIIHTTPRDNHNQETRYTKTKYDDKTNSLEPTESVTPVSYSASPRPKMLYNGSQSYSPDQYDPFYAVYDEDGELYKDTDYVQQYNTASLRPAVQQTYRGTPPPARRPVETYTPRPVSVDDYDDALIQGQISNQNQFQSPVRHSTRGDGNELGYEHNPSSVKTTFYEATSISTTPSTTTSTSTTTQRPTTAPYTEAMTPSRFTARSSTDENPNQNSEPSSNQDPTDGPRELDPTSPSPLINLSSLAKPFEKTDNSHRLSETLLTTEKISTSRQFSRTNDEISLDEVPPSSKENKKVVSLTSGFSIRRNPNNTNNPYTLTVLTRPFEDYSKLRRENIYDSEKSGETQEGKYYHYDSDDDRKSINSKSTTSTPKYETTVDVMDKRSDYSMEKEEKTPLFYVRPRTRPESKTRYVASTEPTLLNKGSTKYYIKTVVRRPAQNVNSGQRLESTENSINTDLVSETFINNQKLETDSNISTNVSRIVEEPQFEESDESLDEPSVSPYKSLDNLRSGFNNHDNLIQESTTSSTSTTPFYQPTQSKPEKPRSKPSYYSYRVEDEIVPDQTTEIFSGTVRNVIRAFFNNIASTPTPRLLDEFSITTRKTTPQPEEKVVNINFQKKTLKYIDDKPLRNNVKRIQIVTEPSVNRFIPLDNDVPSITESAYVNDFTTTSTALPPHRLVTEPITPLKIIESSTNKDFRTLPDRQSFESKFNLYTTTSTTNKPELEKSYKFHKLLQKPSSDSISYDNTSHRNIDDDVVTKQSNIDTTKTPEIEWNRPTNRAVSEIASTTSTTKATSTVKIEPTYSTKSLSFPTRASRVNPAIKLAATNPGGGRRSYQTSSKCSSDNSLQANPKCNEIKYQRPSSTRGRGSAHYSTASDAPQPVPNRGTPPTRSRPTLKPSTAIVSESTKFVDIYAHPPSRPAPVYPQPTPDKTAAKCRKDVCLLPDCYCGGRDIPGDLPVESVPQIVLLTFDDSVNDLNKGLYADLFEKGRVNPNGCPIAATFYVSHEWTDYSQVQNLYAAGHEMASHTVSHSFGEQFSQKKWNREVGGQREILAAYGGVKLEDVRGMRAPFLSVGGNKMFKMLYDSNFTYDSSLPVYENRPPSWPYTLDYKLFHDCMIPPCPTKSYPGVWEVPMVMWQDLNGGRCSMGDACANPPDAEGVYKMILKNFDRHYTTNRAPFGLYYHAAWFTQPHHKEGFIMFLDFINQMSDVWIVTNWQALQWVRDPTPINRLNNFQPFQCNYQDRPKKCNNPKVCNLWHKSGVRYMRTCQPCPEIYPWTGKTGIKSSRIDNDIGE